jgi:hypothetical protein
MRIDSLNEALTRRHELCAHLGKKMSTYRVGSSMALVWHTNILAFLLQEGNTERRLGAGRRAGSVAARQHTYRPYRDSHCLNMGAGRHDREGFCFHEDPPTSAGTTRPRLPVMRDSPDIRDTLAKCSRRLLDRECPIGDDHDT